MAELTRIFLSRSGEVECSAEDYWRALRDWNGIMNWWPKESAPMPIKSSSLKPGHSPDRIPCTRILQFDMSKLPPGFDTSAMPDQLQETLTYVDEESRTLYYTLDGKTPLGLRNYFAWTTVDSLGPNRARITNSGRGDLPIEVPVDAILYLMGETFERGVIHGIAAYAARKRKG
jgi:hypothetical protein